MGRQQRLMTCGGDYDHAASYYKHNLVCSPTRRLGDHWICCGISESEMSHERARACAS